MKNISDVSSLGMQSTGQTATQEPSFNPMQGCVMTYAMTIPILSGGLGRTLLQPVAVARHGDQDAAPMRTVTELGAQPPDELVDPLGRDVGGEAVDLAHDLVAADRDAGVAGQVLEEAELERRQVERLAGNRDHPGREVDLDLPEAPHPLLVGSRLGRLALGEDSNLADVGLQPGDQLPDPDRLGEGVVGA